MYVFCELVCANCSGHIVGQWTKGTIPRRALRKTAPKQTIFVGLDVFCSEDCLKKFKQSLISENNPV